MVNSENFAKRLQIIMDYYGLTSSGLADEIEFNRSSISHLLSGRNKPSLEFVMKVLEKFPDVKLYWLLNGKGNFPDAEKEKNVEEKIIQSTPPTQKTENLDQKEKTQLSFKNHNSIERIVIFYKDGTFKEYKN